MAAMSAIVGFSHLLVGFDNKTLTGLMGSLLDVPYTSRHATYDLRRLRRKGLIERIEHTPAAGPSSRQTKLPSFGRR